MVEIAIVIKHRRGQDFPMIGWYCECAKNSWFYIKRSHQFGWTVENNVEWIKDKAAQVVERITQDEISFKIHESYD